MKVKIEGELRDLIPGYLENRTKDCAAIKSLLAQPDLAGIRRLGHNMKGTGAGYGLPKISEIGSSLEIAAQSGDSAAIQRHVADLEDFLRSVDIEYTP